MVNTCVCYGCNNSSKTGHSVHKFPPDINKRLQWTRFVSRKRADFKIPVQKSDAVICEVHFEEHCYNFLKLEFNEQIGGKRRKTLIDGSVPTIDLPTKRSGSPPKSLPKRRAAGKLQVARLIHESTTSDSPAASFETQDDKIIQGSRSVDIQTDKVSCINSGTQCFLKLPSKPPFKSRAVNTCQPLMVHTGTQCTLLTDEPQKTINIPPPTSTPVGRDGTRKLVEFSRDNCLSPITPVLPNPSDDDDDIDYKPSDMSIDEAVEEEAERSSDSLQHASTEFCKSPAEYASERKYIVFRHKLLELFRICPLCGSDATAEVDDSPQSGHGTLVKVSQKCTSCGFTRIWDSQPYSSRTPVGNLLLSAAIVISGSQISQVLRLFSIFNIKCYSRSTFNKQQTNFVIPTILNGWKTEQASLINHLRETHEGLDLAGDCRNDSPGHSAKFGCYTLMEQSTKKVLDLQIVQSNEAGSSNACELVGFKRSMSLITETELLRVRSLVTDRHLSITAFIRDELTVRNPMCFQMKHYNDVWHTAKGIKKKVDKIGKRYPEVSLWNRSIVNHVYYIATAASGEDRETNLEGMWLSLDNHIHDRHEHDSDVYPYCEHSHVIYDREKEWLVRGTKGSLAISELLTSTRTIKDIKRLSPQFQTSALEAFHSLVIRFAPKHTNFSWLGLTARTCVAAMHHNENANRMQATTRDGREQYRVCFPKFKAGNHTVKPVKTGYTLDYADRLVLELLESHDRNPRALKNSIYELRQEQPETLSASFAHPNKEDAVQQHNPMDMHEEPDKFFRPCTMQALFADVIEDAYSCRSYYWRIELLIKFIFYNYYRCIPCKVLL